MLALSIEEFGSETSWRWVLTDPDGKFVGDQVVALDKGDPVYAGFEDLPRRLKYLQQVHREQDVLAELGRWIGEKVFGQVGAKLLEFERAPACVVQVRVPQAAQALVFRPFELAHVDGRSLVERGFRFIYTVDGGAARRELKKEGGEELRMLGVFSLPDAASPLNLREERFRLQELIRDFAQKGGYAVRLRILQYGTTRSILKEALEEAPGWDVIHFSGHGLQGELLLEKLDGSADRVSADELAKLLAPTKQRLKLMALSACYSGAADVGAARVQLGLDSPPTRAEGAASSEPTPAPTPRALPSLGQRLAETLDCAVLAMRYPVLDTFATELALGLYQGLLERKQPLPQALRLALDGALSQDGQAQDAGLSPITPLLFGARAGSLVLGAPKLP
ncbi:MAG TPA: CHAT domain-containing protein, partial [Myxococcales bacterium]|nr:CHAT domain-containing protein [Myxococcales bacterium]